MPWIQLRGLKTVETSQDEKEIAGPEPRSHLPLSTSFAGADAGTKGEGIRFKLKLPSLSKDSSSKGFHLPSEALQIGNIRKPVAPKEAKRNASGLFQQLQRQLPTRGHFDGIDQGIVA